MATAFFGGDFFGGEFFSVATEAEEVVKTGTGGIDPGELRKHRYPPAKPLGILHLPKKPLKEGRKEVSDRVEESRQIQSEIAARLAREFTEETALLDRPPVETMTMAEVEAEIGVLLRKKLRTDNEEVILFFLMIAASK